VPNWPLIAASVLAALPARPAGAPAQTVGHHPDPRYIQAPSVPHFEASLADPPVPAPFHLGDAPLARFGGPSDPDDLLLGDILDAVFLPGSAVAVLDDKLFHLRLFDPHGGPGQTLGREGQGPGEFARRLVAFAADSDGTLFVVDLSRSVKVFGREPDGYHYRSAVPLGMGAQSLCLLGPLMVVNGLVGGRPEILHTFRLDGSRVADFATLYVSPNFAVNYQYSRGLIACDPARQLIYLTAEGGFGDVRAYRPDGSAVWRTTIAGFRSNIVTDRDNGYTVEGSPDGVHTAFSLTLLPGIGLLLQVAHRTPDDLRQGAWYSTLTSFLLDPSTGRPAMLGTALPPIRAATGARALVVSEDPVPRFEVRRLGQP
jgi:hypothetical protein